MNEKELYEICSSVCENLSCKEKAFDCGIGQGVMEKVESHAKQAVKEALKDIKLKNWQAGVEDEVLTPKGWIKQGISSKKSEWSGYRR